MKIECTEGEEKGLEAGNVNFSKYRILAEKTFFKRMGKVVNVVGLTIESAGPEARLGDICYIYPNRDSEEKIMAEVVGFKDSKTLLMPYEATGGIAAGLCGGSQSSAGWQGA